MSVQKEHFKNYFMVSCHIKDNNNFVFVAEEPMKEPDPFELRKLCIIQYYGNDYSNNDFWSRPRTVNNTRMYCSSLKKQKQWLFVSFWGDVLRTPEKIDKDSPNVLLEEEIPPLELLDHTRINRAKVIAGKMYTVSGYRDVRRRDDKDHWTILNKGIPKNTFEEKYSEVGFIDIDGFSENDIYAAGNGPDVWNWNGKLWSQIEIPTNAYIKGVCCADDGQVYLSTDMDSFVVGRGDRWKIIKHDLDVNFRNMVWFKDRVYMAAGSTLYEIKEGKFKESKLNDMKDRPVDWSCLDANDDIMLAGSKLEVATFDGEKFTTVIPF